MTKDIDLRIKRLDKKLEDLILKQMGEEALRAYKRESERIKRARRT